MELREKEGVFVSLFQVGTPQTNIPCRCGPPQTISVSAD